MTRVAMLVFLCVNLGCCVSNCPSANNVVDVVSEECVVVCGKKIEIAASSWMDSHYIVPLLQSKVGWSLCDRSCRTVSLRVEGDVHYYCIWSLVHALSRMGCDVFVPLGAGDVMVTTRMPTTPYGAVGLYLADVCEMRSYKCKDSSFPYLKGEISIAARAVITMRQDENSDYFEFLGHALMPSHAILDVLSVAREKGYERVNLFWPTFASVKDAVDSGEGF